MSCFKVCHAAEHTKALKTLQDLRSSSAATPPQKAGTKRPREPPAPAASIPTRLSAIDARPQCAQSAAQALGFSPEACSAAQSAAQAAILRLLQERAASQGTLSWANSKLAAEF